MFATVHGDSLHDTTKGLASADSTLSTLVNKHGARKFWAAVKAQGLEPDDVDRAAPKDAVTVHPRVPAASAPQIMEHRTKMWDDLRLSRLHAVEITLENLSDDKVRRYWKCESGVNPISAKDLPPVDQLGGMEHFEEMQAKQHGRVKEEQRRKAMALGLEFLTEKKKREDAEAKTAAFDARMVQYRKDQAVEWKEKAVLSQKKADTRKQASERAAKARKDYDDETEAALWERVGGAKARRNHQYSPEGLAAKLAANKQKRIAAFQQATELEEEMLNRLEDKRIACEERLEARRQEVEARLSQQRSDAQAAFHKKQVVIHARTTEWVENVLEEHKKFKAKVEDGRDQYKTNMKEKSKSCSDIRKKATDKVNQNKGRLQNQSTASNEELMMKHHEADIRREELNQMKFKNENDIFTFREMKHHTFGELTRRRNTEIKKRTDAHNQALIIDLAERKVKGHATDHAAKNLFNCRQQISKESLTLKDKAAEGFIAMAREPDESKVIATMNAMGFEMPKLPEKDEEGGEEDGAPKKAF